MTDAEMDRIIAKKVMGWHEHNGYWMDEHGQIVLPVLCWHPGTDAAQAVQALEAMRDKGFRWHAESVEDYVSVSIYGKLANGKSEDKNFAHAVCMALVAAVTP